MDSDPRSFREPAGKLYTETQVADALHRQRRWLLDWLREHPTDVHGRPFYYQLGKSKRFTGDDVVRLIDHILIWESGARQMPTGDGHVYFVDGGDCIKIGFSRALNSRMRSLGTNTPLGAKIIHLEPGTFSNEKELHRQFAKDRVRGEWFRKSPELLNYIEQRKQVLA